MMGGVIGFGSNPTMAEQAIYEAEVLQKPGESKAEISREILKENGGSQKDFQELEKLLGNA